MNEPQNGHQKLGIVWDFDGTLFDTREKNLAVTREIVRRVLGRSPEHFPILESVRSYDEAQRSAANWREFYRHHFSLDDVSTERAGNHWVEFQLRETTRAMPIEGIVDVIRKLGSLPHGVVSQNAREVIVQSLARAELTSYFASIVGHGQVPVRRQKPAPDGIFLCLEELASPERNTILFVGDHETDAQTAHNANLEARNLGISCRFLSVAAAYHTGVQPANWQQQPDFVANKPEDILELVANL